MSALLKESDYAKGWFVFILAATIVGALAGAVLGALMGAVLAGAGASLDIVRTIASITGGLAGLAVSYFLFRYAVRRFIVSKLSPSDAET